MLHHVSPVQLDLISTMGYVKSHVLQDSLQVMKQENALLVQLTVLPAQLIQMINPLVLNVLILTFCIDNSVLRPVLLDSIRILNSNGVQSVDAIALLALLMMYVIHVLESLLLKALEFVQFNTVKMLLQYLL